MNIVWIVVLLVIIGIAVAFQRKQTVEGFGVFSCSPITYDQLINDTYTPHELQAFLTASWNTQTPDQKNQLIAAWDATPCQDQNDTYTAGVAARDKRAGIDKLFVIPAPSSSP
jgi:hypothetical protein